MSDRTWAYYLARHKRREASKASRREADRGRPTSKKRRSLRRVVFVRDQFTCQECQVTIAPPPGWDGERVVGLTLGHIVAHSRGGYATHENLRVECAPCNVRRGAQPLDGDGPEPWRLVDLLTDDARRDLGRIRNMA